jgi:competence protein ComEC
MSPTALPPAAVVGAGTWAGCLGLWAGRVLGLGPVPALAGVLVAVLVVLGLGRLLRAGAAGPVALGLLLGAVSCTGFWAAARPPALVDAARAGEQAVVTGRVVAAERPGAVEIGHRPLLRVVVAGAVVRPGDAAPLPAGSVTLLVPDHRGPLPHRGAQVRLDGRLLPPLLWREPAMAVRGSSLELVAPPPAHLEGVAAIRERMWSAYAGIDPDAASLAAGLAIGDDSRQSPDLATAMRDSGLSHLSAVSGGNVAIVLGLVLALAALLRAPPVPRTVVGVAAVVGYAWFVGPEPSVLRAGVMGAVAVVGVLLGARRGGWPLLGSAVTVLLVVRPGLGLSWGFALSVAATAGIIGLAGPAQRAVRARIPRASGLATALGVTLAAQVATAPLVAAMTGTVSLAALPANLAAEALVAPITVLGLLVALVAGAWVPPAAALARLVEPPALLLAAIARTCADLPFGTVAVPGGAAGAALVAAVLLALGLARRAGRIRGLARRAGRIRGLAFGPVGAVAGVAVLLAAVLQHGAGRPPRDWVVIACDIGQGDAFLIRAGPGEAVLVDTGPDAALLRMCLERAGVRRVALLLLTHFDTDHVAAVPAVLAHHRPAAVLASPVPLPAANAEQVAAAVQRSGVPWQVGAPGQRWRVGETVLDVLWPRRVIDAGSVSNNAAMATAVSVAGMRILFPGDLEPLGQAGLMASAPAGAFDVTTIPHHGSAHQHPDFLRWTGGRTALVSAGRGNPFGHPRPQALELAAGAGMTVGRTDADGPIAVVVRDGAPVLVRYDPAPGGGSAGAAGDRATMPAWQVRRARARVPRAPRGAPGRRSSTPPQWPSCSAAQGRAPPPWSWCSVPRTPWPGWSWRACSKAPGERAPPCCAWPPATPRPLRRSATPASPPCSAAPPGSSRTCSARPPRSCSRRSVRRYPWRGRTCG